MLSRNSCVIFSFCLASLIYFCAHEMWRTEQEPTKLIQGIEMPTADNLFCMVGGRGGGGSKREFRFICGTYVPCYPFKMTSYLTCLT